MGTDEKTEKKDEKVEAEPETETDIRIKALENEFVRAKSETRQLMLDIRALLMEAWSPLRNQPNDRSQNNGPKG
jgi:hypothetical protein